MAVMRPKQVMFHSAQGSQYTSDGVRRVLAAHGIILRHEPQRGLPAVGDTGRPTLLLRLLTPGIIKPVSRIAYAAAERQHAVTE